MTQAPLHVLTTSSGIRRLPMLAEFLDAQVMSARSLGPLASLRFNRSDQSRPDVIAGWGARPSGQKAEWLARKLGIECWRLEDGFLRSFGLGNRFAPLSLTVDPVGIYYDATRPSALENLLNSREGLPATSLEQARQARGLIIEHRLSKYNLAPDCEPGRFTRSDRQVILVVDQTRGDRSIELSGANEASFPEMLAAARAENPYAHIIIKTHPEVFLGRKAGHFSDISSDTNTTLLTELVNPISLLEQVDAVYTVSSQIGFEALMLGKPVHCFGIPWYAGWGQTQDRKFCARRRERRSIDDLFAAAYLHLSRYLNPYTHKRGSIFDVIEFLRFQREMAAKEPMISWCVGFRRWKAYNVRPLIGLHQDRIRFVNSLAEIGSAHSAVSDARAQVIHWGAPTAIRSLKESSELEHVQMEDGFIRSVGLGSDLVRPSSLVLDRTGIYFDPAQPSDLERLLAYASFSKDELNRAARVRALLVKAQLTKYNTDTVIAPDWSANPDQSCLLVPGQVVDDASVRLAGAGIKTNLELLQRVRHYNPDAFIVFRPHPDVMSGNRKGALPAREALKYADYIEYDAGILGCIEKADEVHTLSSLAGFDALIRKKPVTTYGQPFYAGWGLTRDFAPVLRRHRRLSLDELVAGCLLSYPRYWDWTLNAYTDCEAALNQLIEQRNVLAGKVNGAIPRVNYWQRQFGKLVTLGKAWTAH